MSDHAQVSIADTSQSILPSQNTPAFQEKKAEAEGQKPESGTTGGLDRGTIPETERPEWLPEKFKSAEDLAKAYAELEQRLGGEPKPKPKETKVDDETLPQQDLLDELTEEFSRTGTLSEGSYERLEKAGIRRKFANTYIAGVLEMSARRTEALYEQAGGEEQYRQIVGWAAENISDNEKRAYNDVINSGNIEAAKLAIAGLASRFQREHGSDNLVKGRPATGKGIEPYLDVRQITADMAKPEYKLDPAFRDKVRRRIAMSKVM